MLHVLLTILHLHHLNAWADLVALHLKLVGVVMTLPIGLGVEEDPKPGITSKSSLERMVRENMSGKPLATTAWAHTLWDEPFRWALEKRPGETWRGCRFLPRSTAI